MYNNNFKKDTLKADFCVVGGGMAGFIMALACARKGHKVILMHDRPVLGGNASSECRVQIAGADRNGAIPNMRETGILEELRLENCYRNPNSSYSVWDMVLYGKAEEEPNLELILNCSCLDAKMNGNNIKSVTGWQTTTQKYLEVEARLFADCSGDGILAPLTGADFRVGREARKEFNESIAPVEADLRTMGMSCIFQTSRHETSQPFVKPEWANSYPDDNMLPYGADGHKNLYEGYWWAELGGMDDSIGDTEKLRKELLKILLGVWDHIKNYGGHGADNIALDWLQFLPSKRESRRYVGDYIITQNDIESGGKFEDTVAYGGWSMDDHHPAGFYAVNLNKPATIFHKVPSPYGIPYRCLYSRNIDNLFVGGRLCSCTHAALSSTRVIGTCSVMGQAAGTAAALALQNGISPRDVGKFFIKELQQDLISHDCYLPGIKLEKKISFQACDGLNDGFTRPINRNSHQWDCAAGDSLILEFEDSKMIKEIKLIFNSGLQRYIALVPGNDGCKSIPEELIKAFSIELKIDGKWQHFKTEKCNYKRLYTLSVSKESQAIRINIIKTWGASKTGIHSVIFS